MPRRDDIKRVLVIGSGPVVVGQAAEFDYAGSQACLSLREDGVKVVLLNSNPATIQTDHSIADRVYIEPLEAETIVKIFENERVDAILPTMGGQTALNLALLLDKMGVLESHGVKIIGTGIQSIELAENRKKFHSLMMKIGEPVVNSVELTKENFNKELDKFTSFPVVVRTSFSLGGLSGGIFNTREEVRRFAHDFFISNKDETIEMERSIKGLKEIEYEVIRDNVGNCITVCNMENLDPMGVHTGESIVVTPSQTLSDIEYHFLRDSAIKVINALDIKGACNIQFALNQSTEEYYIVEVNPRTSRSSALASKASGYPIARISTKIALGYNLNEIKNPITKNTYAAYEPSLDYVTVKIPRWPFDKFPVSREIGIQMKSIGEVMGIGRTFEEGLMKAISSLDIQESSRIRTFVSDENLQELIKKQSDLKIFYIIEALFRGYDVESVSKMSEYDEYFVFKINNVVTLLRRLKIGEYPENINELKKLGISDSQISYFTKIPETDIVKSRLEKGIIPAFKAIDTCSGEFDSITPYLYSTYEDESEFEEYHEGEDKVVVIGSGPNRISQGLEFDYGAVKAVITLKKMGLSTVMINSNPETVSTDFDVSDYLFFEPLTLEHISNVIYREKPKGVIIQFSGQTGQNIASNLSEIFGEEIILGTKPADINRIEDRTIFAQTLKRLGIKQPEFVTMANEHETDKKINNVKLPVIVRSSFIIGGRAMDIVYDLETLNQRVKSLFSERPGFPILVSKYIEGATEMDVDFVSNTKASVICAVSVHIEEAGVHSGDATMVIGPGMVDDSLYEKIKKTVDLLTGEFNLSGISNLQIAVKDDEIFVIELNARASRSLPFASKATGVDWVSKGMDSIISERVPSDRVKPRSYFIKVPVFPFRRFADLDIILGPEMKSTGEGMGAGITFEEAMQKAIKIYHKKFKLSKGVLLTVNDSDKEEVVEIAKALRVFDLDIFSTPGTYNFLKRQGVESKIVYRMVDVRGPKISDLINEGNISLIINTPTMRSGPVRDGFGIRRLAIQNDIMIISNIKFAKAIVDALLRPLEIDYREIREYYGS